MATFNITTQAGLREMAPMPSAIAQQQVATLQQEQIPDNTPIQARLDALGPTEVRCNSFIQNLFYGCVQALMLQKTS